MLLNRQLVRKIASGGGGGSSITDKDNPNLTAFFDMQKISADQLIDVSPNDNNGTITGATQVDGIIDHALTFNGSTTYVETVTYPLINSCSVSFWAKIDSFTNSFEFYGDIDSGGDGTDSKVRLGVTSGGNWRLFLGNGDGVSGVDSDQTIASGLVVDTWYHIVQVINGTNIKVYVDTVLSADVTLAYSIASAASTIPWTLGRNGQFSGSLWFPGALDQVRRFNNYVLSTDEIQTLYEEGIPNAITDADHPNTKNLYSFDQIESTILVDASNNQEDMIVVGALPAAGAIGNALDFNGTSDHCIRALNADDKTQTLTYSAWVYVESLPAAEGRIITASPIGAGSFGRGMFIGINSAGKPILSIGTNSAFVYATGATTLSLNTWYLITGTYNSGVGRIYLNGTEDGSNLSMGVISWSDADGIGPSSAQLYINGTRDNTAGTAANILFTDGRIDQARTFNKALSAAEVATLFTEGTPAITDNDHPDLRMLFTGMRYSGSSVIDDSNNGNNGALTSVATAVGNYGTAMVFGGVSSFIDLTQAVEDLFVASEASFAVWIKPKLTGNDCLIGVRAPTNSLDPEAVRFQCQSDGSLWSRTGTGSNNLVVQSAAGLLTVDQWHFVVFNVTHTSNTQSTVTIYLDGAQVATGSGSHADISIGNAKSAHIGKLPWSSTSNAYEGDIELARVFNRILTPTEITALFDEGAAPAITSEEHPNLVNRLDFENIIGTTVHDSSNFGNDGTKGGSVGAQVAGVVGQALNFPGGTDTAGNSVQMVDDPSYAFGTGDFSACIWVNPNPHGTKNYGVMGKDTYPGSGSTYTGWFVTLNTTNTILFATRDVTGGSGNQTYFTTTGTAPDSTWTFVSCVRENGVLKVSFDGGAFETLAEVGATDVDNASNMKVAWFDDDTVIGAGDGNTPFDGQLDQFRLFNRALTLAEVQSLYNSGNGA